MKSPVEYYKSFENTLASEDPTIIAEACMSLLTQISQDLKDDMSQLRKDGRFTVDQLFSLSLQANWVWAKIVEKQRENNCPLVIPDDLMVNFTSYILGNLAKTIHSQNLQPTE